MLPAWACRYDPLSWEYPSWASINGPAVNILKGALLTSDRVVTVSEVRQPAHAHSWQGMQRDIDIFSLGTPAEQCTVADCQLSEEASRGSERKMCSTAACGGDTDPWALGH